MMCRSAAVTAAMLLFAGCALGDLEDDPEIGSSAFTLCTDDAPDATVAFVNAGGASTATSAFPTNQYDHPACSDRFTVEVTGVASATQQYSVDARWGEALPNAEGPCELTIANVQTHEYGITGFDCSGLICVPVYGWDQVGGEITMRGNWIPFFGGGFCSLVPDTPLPVFQPTVFRSKVRVAVRAYAWALFFPVYKRAEAGLYSVPPIN